MKTKCCSKCSQEKPLPEFYKSSRLKDGYQSNCKICSNIMSAASMKKKPEKYATIRKQESDRLIKRVLNWKQDKGCCSCGEDEPICLELHHKDPNTKEVQPNKLRTYKWERFLEEARKCILVCSNCHKKIHAGILDDSMYPLITE